MAVRHDDFDMMIERSRTIAADIKSMAESLQGVVDQFAANHEQLFSIPVEDAERMRAADEELIAAVALMAENATQAMEYLRESVARGRMLEVHRGN